MIVFKEAATLTKQIGKLKSEGKSIGFVPTMGALHPGHISLLELSKSRCDVTVCSIFVNPTQFNDPKDFEKYPVTIPNDIKQLIDANCDIVFLPAVSEIYPEGTTAAEYYDLGDIEFLLEGKYRPGHFQGVCQVVHRLLEITLPHFIFIGQKDYQQCMVIKKLIDIKKFPVQVVIGSTHREESGLAMSSRNLRLNKEEQDEATTISRMLRFIKDNYTTTPLPDLQEQVTDNLLDNGFRKVDYVAIADADTLQPVDDVTKTQKAVALIAAFIGDVRLIDNMVIAE